MQSFNLDSRGCPVRYVKTKSGDDGVMATLSREYQITQHWCGEAYDKITTCVWCVSCGEDIGSACRNVRAVIDEWLKPFVSCNSTIVFVFEWLFAQRESGPFLLSIVIGACEEVTAKSCRHMDSFGHSQINGV